MAEAFSSSLRLTGEAKEYVSTEYGKLGKILEENRESGRAASFLYRAAGTFCIVFQMDSPCLYPGKYTGRGIAHDAECQ